ncbi:MAG: TetR family transcriptional regulator [Alphaproteobacteria bacterium]|nr:TetR family transcriptional regulator [Alphaproteobacteria bacterium]
MATESLDDTAKKILHAASSRFLHYGYGKTTMSEIAKDCNMSTGNVYRYFPSKMDIAQTFVRSLQRDQIARLKRVANEPGLTPQGRLRSLLKTNFRIAYDRFHNRPKAYELSEEILKERPEFAVDWETAENELIAQILEEGAQSGVFPRVDAQRTAKIIQDAVYRFTSPAVFHEGDFELLSGELDEVIDLILDAFAWRAAPAR